MRYTKPTIEEIKALDGKILAMLDKREQAVLDFYYKQGRKFGVAVSVIKDKEIDPEVLAKASSHKQAEEILKTANSRVSVIVKPQGVIMQELSNADKDKIAWLFVAHTITKVVFAILILLGVVCLMYLTFVYFVEKFSVSTVIFVIGGTLTGVMLVACFLLFIAAWVSRLHDYRYEELFGKPDKNTWKGNNGRKPKK